MFEEQISQVIRVFQSLDGISKCVFAFWMGSAIAFYGMLVYIVVAFIREGILRISRLSRI
jgi:low affinity Fe/Cu permease